MEIAVTFDQVDRPIYHRSTGDRPITGPQVDRPITGPQVDRPTQVHRWTGLSQVHRCLCTSSISEHHFLFVHQPAEAGELQVFAPWGLDCDVPAVPVVLHPVLVLFNLHQHDLAQILTHGHIIGVNLKQSIIHQ